MPHVTVRTKEGCAHFNRAGLRFTREATSHEVTEEQLAALKAEPMLEVTEGAAPSKASKAKHDADADESSHGRHTRK